MLCELVVGSGHPPTMPWEYNMILLHHGEPVDSPQDARDVIPVTQESHFWESAQFTWYLCECVHPNHVMGTDWK